MLSRLGQHLLRAKSKAEHFGLFSLYSCYFLYLQFGSPMTNFWLLLGKQSHYPMLITAFGLPIFDPKVARRDWVSTPNWVPSGLWSQCHNPLSHSPQIAENTLPRRALNFYKIWKCPQSPVPKTVIPWPQCELSPYL